MNTQKEDLGLPQRACTLTLLLAIRLCQGGPFAIVHTASKLVGAVGIEPTQYETGRLRRLRHTTLSNTPKNSTRSKSVPPATVDNTLRSFFHRSRC